MSRRWTVRHGSDQLPHRNVRRLARQLLRRGVEPEPPLPDREVLD